jgi:hypothetical protein
VQRQQTCTGLSVDGWWREREKQGILSHRRSTDLVIVTNAPTIKESISVVGLPVTGVTSASW